MSKPPAPGKRVWAMFAAGQVRRWHTKGYIVRSQDVAQHSFGVANWIALLHVNPSARLLKAALHHDLPELHFGDPPRYAKQSDPAIKKLLDDGEMKIALRYELQREDELDAEELAWLHSCDLLDAWLFLMQNIIANNEMVRLDFMRATQELRRRTKTGEYPEEPCIAMDQILAMHSWIKTW